MIALCQECVIKRKANKEEQSEAIGIVLAEEAWQEGSTCT